MNISFLCGGGGPKEEWADPSVEQGIGGSEECLIYLARALARAGHRVRVYNHCGNLAGLHNGVAYVPYTVEPYPGEDLLVAWRDWTLLIGKNAEQKWMWTHDQPVGNHAPARDHLELALQSVDQWVFLNAHHKNRYAMIPEDRAMVIPIGVQEMGQEGVAMVEPSQRLRGRVIYFSEPARGLNELRTMWADVKRKAPLAQLAAFWWDESKFMPPVPELDILPMAKLGPAQVALECQRASVWAYPCTFDGEISPATALKAQIGGAVPCVIPKGGLHEMVKFGVKTDRAHFVKMLGHLLIAEQRQDNMRYEMMRFMKTWMGWDEIAARWGKAWELARRKSYMLTQN